MVLSIKKVHSLPPFPVGELSPEDIKELEIIDQQFHRPKRSGSGDLLSTLKSALVSGFKKKIGQIAKGSAAASGAFVSASSSKEGHSYHHSYEHDHEHEVYPHKSFDFWELKKSILNTLLQAVKAIKGGVLAIKGQLIKGSGYIVSAKGRLISSKGEAVTNLGKNIIKSAVLIPPGDHPSDYGHYSAPSAVYHESAPGAVYAAHDAHYQHTGEHHEDKLLPGTQSGVLILKKIPPSSHHTAEETKIPDFKPLSPSGPSFSQIVGKFVSAASSLDPHKPSLFDNSHSHKTLLQTHDISYHQDSPKHHESLINHAGPEDVGLLDVPPSHTAINGFGEFQHGGNNDFEAHASIKSPQTIKFPQKEELVISNVVPKGTNKVKQLPNENLLSKNKNNLFSQIFKPVDDTGTNPTPSEEVPATHSLTSGFVEFEHAPSYVEHNDFETHVPKKVPETPKLTREQDTVVPKGTNNSKQLQNVNLMRDTNKNLYPQFMTPVKYENLDPTTPGVVPPSQATLTGLSEFEKNPIYVENSNLESHGSIQSPQTLKLTKGEKLIPPSSVPKGTIKYHQPTNVNLMRDNNKNALPQFMTPVNHVSPNPTPSVGVPQSLTSFPGLGELEQAVSFLQSNIYEAQASKNVPHAVKHTKGEEMVLHNTVPKGTIKKKPPPSVNYMRGTHKAPYPQFLTYHESDESNLGPMVPTMVPSPYDLRGSRLEFDAPSPIMVNDFYTSRESLRDSAKSIKMGLQKKPSGFTGGSRQQIDVVKSISYEIGPNGPKSPHVQYYIEPNFESEHRYYE